ncbi:MAG: VOC family protein [Patescibacteria group bacterium]|nr:VOC family protein [Patescibacteria group bacterium]MCL5431508.1 VOC family protein [Patescibacteria group bacterium]
MKLGLRKLILDIRVRDLDRATSFYGKTLGLTLIHKDTDWASFEAFGAEIHLYLHGGTKNGMEFRASDLEEQVKVLKKRDVKFLAVGKDEPNLIKTVGNINYYPWGEAAYFNDSEGNQIALVEDK